MKLVEPKVYLINDVLDIVEYLEHRKIDWRPEDYLSFDEALMEFAGRLCYESWTVEGEFDNKNLTKVREGNQNYLGNIIKQGHGAVVEHGGPLVFLFSNVSRVFSHELVRHRAGCAYCLSGDTLIYSGSKQNGKFDGIKKKWSLKALYDWSNDPKRSGRIKLITVRIWDGKEFIQGKIKKVMYSGKKDTFNLVAGKYSIKASKDHLFLTKEGWKRLEEINVGEEIACNGKFVKGQIPWNKGLKSNLNYKHSDEIKEKIRQSKLGDKNPKWQGDRASKQAGRYRAKKLYSTCPCSKCENPNGHRHHIDRNTLNNSPENILFLCNSCHASLHYIEDGARKLTIKWTKVNSKNYVGIEDTYDLEVDSDHHNFVANGIVTHNSQTSGRYVRGNDIKFWIPKSLEPAKEEICDIISLIETQYQRLERIIGVDKATDFGTKKKLTSALRRILPNGQANNILMSCNHRAMRHMINMRTSAGAEEEIRLVFDKVAEMVKSNYPNIYQDMEKQEDGSWQFSNGKI